MAARRIGEIACILKGNGHASGWRDALVLHEAIDRRVNVDKLSCAATQEAAHRETRNHEFRFRLRF
jgi:hypothetical protein